MNFPSILAIIAGIFLIAGYIPYIYEIIKNKTTPSRMSWFIWSLSTAIILFGVKGTGTNEAIWVPIADALGCFIIFILSIPKGVGGWTKTDKISLAICVSSLFIWWYTGSLLVALLMNLLVYVSGYIPTIEKAFYDPKSESYFAWTLFFIGVILNLIVVIIGTDTGFTVWLYPTVLVACVGTLFVFLNRKVEVIKKSSLRKKERLAKEKNL
jgi:hypothetical protein